MALSVKTMRIACLAGALTLSAWCAWRGFDHEPDSDRISTRCPIEEPAATESAAHTGSRSASVVLEGRVALPRGWHNQAAGLVLELESAAGDLRGNFPLSGNGTMDTSGRMTIPFRFSGTPPGLYRMGLSPLGLSFDLEVPEGGALDLVLEVPEKCVPPGSPLLEFVTPSGRPLETSVLVLVTGHRGGIAGALTDYRAELSYDWMRGCFRVVEWNPRREPAPRSKSWLWRSDLSAQEFQSILDGVLQLGLADLPVESPARGQDIYGRAITLRILHGTRAWANEISSGCTASPSTVRPSPDEQATFDAAVAFLTRRLDELEMQPASCLDDAYADIEDLRLARAFPRIVEFLGDGEFAGRVDFNRISTGDGTGATICFALAEHQHRSPSAAHAEVGKVGVRIDQASGTIAVALRDLPPAEPIEERKRRRAFVEQHPDLPLPWRELVLRGWIDVGMPPDLVRAIRGEPDRVDPSGEGTLWHYGQRGSRNGMSLTFKDGLVVHFR